MHRLCEYHVHLISKSSATHVKQSLSVLHPKYTSNPCVCTYAHMCMYAHLFDEAIHVYLGTLMSVMIYLIYAVMSVCMYVYIYICLYVYM